MTLHDLTPAARSDLEIVAVKGLMPPKGGEFE